LGGEKKKSTGKAGKEGSRIEILGMSGKKSEKGGKQTCNSTTHNNWGQRATNFKKEKTKTKEKKACSARKKNLGRKLRRTTTRRAKNSRKIGDKISNKLFQSGDRPEIRWQKVQRATPRRSSPFARSKGGKKKWSNVWGKTALHPRETYKNRAQKKTTGTKEKKTTTRRAKNLRDVSETKRTREA